MNVKMIAIPVIALALMGQTCEERLRLSAVSVCNGLASTFAHYDATADSGILSDFRMRQVASVRQQVEAGCTSPSTLTTVALTGIAARAYNALYAAFREGGTLRSARMGSAELQGLRRKLEETGYAN